MANRPSCLTTINDDDDATVFRVCCASDELLPNWDDLKQRPTVHTIRCHDLRPSFDREHHVMLNLSFAIRSHPTRMKAIKFNLCHIEELGHLCMAIMEQKSSDLQQQQQQQQRDRCSMSFWNCQLEIQAAETLRFLLQQNNVLDEISFICCDFSQQSIDAIESGLRENQSLCKLMWSLGRNVPSSRNLFKNTLTELMNVNKNLVSLGLSITGDDDDESYWSLFRAFQQSKTLERLQIVRSHVSVQASEAMMFMLFIANSLKELDFEDCTFDRAAMDFMTQTLSRNKLLDKFILTEQIGIELVVEPPDDETPSTIIPRWKASCLGDLQVNTLDLRDKFVMDSSPLSELIAKVAKNRYIQCLHLSGDMDSEVAWQSICDNILLKNIGPSKLVIILLEPDSIDLITEALQRNTTVQSLTIGDIGVDGIHTFAHGLANMRGLRELCFEYLEYEEEYVNEFFQTIQGSLEVNTTLLTMSFKGDSSFHRIAESYLPRIRYLLALNRVGRQSLMTVAVVPVGLWPFVLARSSNDADGIYFVLSGKPDVLARSRKRKDRDEP